MKFTHHESRTRRSGFTMAEIMIVIAIMGVILAVGIPTVFNVMRRSPMRQAVSDLQDACRAARMMAIVQGKPADLVISAQDGALTVHEAAEEPAERAEPWRGSEPAAAAAGGAETPPPPAPSPGFSARLPDGVAFKKLQVNLRDMMEFDQARVRFYPNGTCDALAATLFSEQNEERTITLEITTGRDHLEVVR
jgi:prepilin-type N-terminal cleavage/methylation domain-containing protein